MNFKSIKDINVQGKTILLRTDLNVPTEDGKVTDTTRIDRLKPTIDYLREAGARILVLSHFGRPDGENNSGLSLAFLAPALQQQWSADVKFCQSTIGEQAETFAASLKDGDIGLLENLRFNKGEKANDSEFAASLAKLGDIYVNDAFSCSHRAHASTEGLAYLLPAAAGLLMEEELKALDAALENPQKPLAAVAGGSKISTKLSVLYNLSERVDFLILGGGMANTFLHAQGIDIGKSLCEKDMADEARKIMEHAKKSGCEIILPVDLVTVTELHENAAYETVSTDNIPPNVMAVDTGPESIKHVTKKIADCKTIVWNGPMGVFEIKPFDEGTNALAKVVAAKTKTGEMVSIAGGGDTVAALENAGTASDFSYISTAGGAFLEWLEGKSLPGIAALEITGKAA
ncbi:MAG: phosphoglycerate kinase [Micavibrio sp.]|nr:MAG: phosphoglycerate kinase [Micavibrio sp.]